MNGDSGSCPHREQLLRRLLEEDDPGTLPPDLRDHVRGCEECGRTLQSLQKMDDLLESQQGESDKCPDPAGPSPKDLGEQASPPPAPMMVPIVVLATALFFALLLFPKSSEIPPTAPVQSPPIPLLPPAPHLILESGKVLLPDGACIIPGKPFPFFDEILTCPDEALLTLEKGLTLGIASGEFRVSPDLFHLLRGRVSTSVDRAGRTFQVKTDAATVGGTNASFSVSRRLDGVTEIICTQGVLSMETISRQKRTLEKSGRLAVNQMGMVIDLK